MKIFMTVSAIIIGGWSSAANAQATRTWVSGVGDDANPCSRTAPCKTFAGAISKTATGGEINTLDPGGFGGVTITKAITIRSDHIEAGVLVSGTNGIIINAGVADKVVLEGLDIEGLGTGINGVDIIQAGDVLIQDCQIRNFTNAAVLISGSSPIRATINKSVLQYSKYGLRVESAGNNGHGKVFNSLIITNANAGISVTGAGNDVLISGNQILGSPKSLDVVSGGVVKSYGNNVLTSGDTPTPTPLQ